jgi:predicted CXXCH cytochrome family protein
LLLAAAALMASPALGAITNTKHDLSSGSAAAIKGTSDELCVYCHTPHGGLTGGFAPLWNRNNGANPTGFYDSSTMDATTNNAGILTSDALLCMSCHDGASLTSALRNPPNSGGAVPGVNIVGAANLGLDMTNDHPIGFVYSTASATDTEIRAVPTNSLNVSYGAANNEMWCSSCHDVHDNTDAPFLAMDNAGSALCLSCHIK